MIVKTKSWKGGGKGGDGKLKCKWTSVSVSVAVNLWINFTTSQTGFNFIRSSLIMRLNEESGIDESEFLKERGDIYFTIDHVLHSKNAIPIRNPINQNKNFSFLLFRFVFLSRGILLRASCRMSRTTSMKR